MPDNDNIAGYIDRNYVKGQAYRLAGCPIPTVFTGNINVISDDLLVRAVTAVDGEASGVFPKTSYSDRYLIETIEYGNGLYLQTAVDSECSEYRRIYTASSDSWTNWIGVSDTVNDFSERIGALESYRDNDSKPGIQANSTNISSLTTRTGALETSSANYNSRINILERRVLSTESSKVVKDCFKSTSGSASVTSCYFYKNGILCSLTFVVKLSADVKTGKDIMAARPGDLLAKYWPPYVATGLGYYGDNSCPVLFNKDGNPAVNPIIKVRNAGDDTLKKGNAFNVNIMWTFADIEEPDQESEPEGGST